MRRVDLGPQSMMICFYSFARSFVIVLVIETNGLTNLMKHKVQKEFFRNDDCLEVRMTRGERSIEKHLFR